MAKSEPLKFSLIENGIDFVREGVSTFFSGAPATARSHKYAILHVFSGILLIMKERLRREHASLIFVEVHQIGPDKRTVTFDQLIQRLDKCAGLALDAAQLRMLCEVQKLRNRIEHYEMDVDQKTAEEAVGHLVEFAFHFLRDQFQVQLEDHLPKNVWRHTQDLIEIAKRLDKEEWERWQLRALPYSGLAEADIDKLRDDYGGDLIECPQCSEDSVVEVGRDVGLCTNPDCHDVVRLFPCVGGCGRATHDGNYCPDCAAYSAKQMDQD